MKNFLALVLALLLGACSVSANTEAAEGGVAQFHAALNAGQHAEIYDSSANDMKSSITKEQFVAFLAGVQRKLGHFQSGKTIGWNVNSTTGGTFVTLNREAQFEKGPGTEEFVFRMQGDRATLAGYHINSNLLLTS